MNIAIFNAACRHPSLASHSWDEVSQVSLSQLYYADTILYLSSINLVHYTYACLHVCTWCIVPLIVCYSCSATTSASTELSVTDWNDN